MGAVAFKPDFLYLMLVMSGSVLLPRWWRIQDAFFQPILRFLTGESGGALNSARYLVLALFPSSWDGRPMAARLR